MNGMIDVKTYRKLPSRLFTVRVPTIATYDPAELELFGIPVDTVDDKPQKESYKDFTTIAIPLVKIIEMYGDGYPIKLVNGDESTIIYNALEKYIKDWTTDMRYSPNMGVNKVDTDKLALVDKFLGEMFEYNKGVIVKDMVRSNSGYGVNVNVMDVHMPNSHFNAPRSNEVVRGKPVGMMSAYGYGSDSNVNTKKEDESRPTPPRYRRYKQPNMPEVNLEEVERKRMIDDTMGQNYDINDLINMK